MCLADGDAAVEAELTASFNVVDCPLCGGALKPDVVFYGGTIPSATNQACNAMLADARGVVAVGTSLQVFSAFRLCRQAVAEGLPLALLNQGATRADELASVHIDEPCSALLPGVSRALDGLME